MNQSSPPNSTANSGANSNKKRRRRPSGGGNKPNAPTGQNPTQSASTSPTKKSGNRSRRGGRNRKNKPAGQNNNGPVLHGIDLVRAKYLNLVEKHVEARRKYYDLFHRADPNQLRKLEREFTDSQAQVLAFENTLKPVDRELLLKDYGGKPEDRDYTSNHELSPEQQVVPTEGDFEDPHELVSQRNSDFKDDREESVGTIDDYKKLKGLI